MAAPELQRGSPYQGLIPYDEADAPFFFGREKEARLIIANLFASPLTLLYGASGVGKSSVLRAGVARQLRAREELLVVVFNAWQSNPLVDLKTKIAEAAGRLNVHLEVPSDSAHLSDFLANCAAQLDRRLMIILDQFEEYFLYHPQEDEFAAEFSRAVTQSGTPISFLISIREDFYAKLDRFEGRIPTLYDNYLRIEHLDRKAARVAIEKPITEYNRQYTTNGHFSIEPELVDTVLRQVETGRVIIGEAGRGVIEAAGAAEQGSARIETPFLQLVMTRLWEKELGDGSDKLRLKTLRDLGGAENIVRTHLDAVVTKLSERDQEIAAGMFHYLVTPSGTKIAYTASDLAGSAELTEAEAVRVLDNLSHGDVRILRTVEPSPDRPGAPRYEIFHDVLAPAILSWRTAYVQTQERADAERRADEQRKRADEQARVAKRLRRLSVALAVVALLALASTVYAIQQRRQAQAFFSQAKTERERAQNQAELARQRGIAADKAELAARDAQTAAFAAEEKAETSRQETAEQIKIAEQRKAEAEQAQGVARVKSMAAAAEKVRANEATIAAEEQARGTRVAFSNLLSVQSKTLLDEHPQLGTLLAVEATRATRAGDPPVPAAEETLRQTLARTGGRIFNGEDWEKDEGTSVMDVSVSPNGRWIASASGSKVRLFDIAANTTAPARTFLGATSPIVFSPDGHWLIASGKPTKDNPPDNKKTSTILLWDLKNVLSNDKPITLNSDQTQFEAIVVSPDSRWLIAGNTTGSTLMLWDLKSSPLTSKSLIVAEPPSAGGVRDSLVTFAMSSDSRWLVTSAGVSQAGTSIQGPGTVRLWDLTGLDRGAQPFQLVGHKYSVTETAFSADGRWLATGTVECDDGVRLWDLKAANPTKPILLDHKGAIGAIAFSPSNQFLVTGSGSRQDCPSDLRARVWNLETIASGAKPYLLPAHEGPTYTIAFSPDETFLVTVVGRGYSEINSPFQKFSYVRVNNARTLGNLGFEGGATVHGLHWMGMAEGETAGQNIPDVIFNLPGIADPIVVSSDSHWLMSRDGNKVRLLDLTSISATGWPMLTMRGHDSGLGAMNFSPDNRWVVTGGSDKTARLWNLASKGLATPLTLAANLPSATNPRENVVVQSPDRRLLVATTDEPSPPGETESSEQSYARFGAVALVSDLTASDPSKALVLRGHKGKIKTATFSKDNRWLVTGSRDLTARLWDLAAADPAAQPRVFSGHQGSVDDVIISPDKHWLATASHDGATRLWNLTDPSAAPVVLSTFPTRVSESYQYTNRVHMSPDGRWLVTSGSYFFGTPAKLWDLKSPVPADTAVTLGPITPEDCVFSPDSRWLLISQIYDGTKKEFKSGPFMWDLTKKPVATPSTPIGARGERLFEFKFTSDGRWLFTRGPEKVIRRWDLSLTDPSAAPLVLNSPFADPKESLRDLVLSPDNRWLVASGPPGDHVLWDLSATDPNSSVRVLKNDGGYGISQVAFDPESRWLVTSADGSASDLEGFLLKRESLLDGHNIRWDLTAPDPSIAPVRLPGGRVVGDESVSADGRWLITTGVRELQFWNMRRDFLEELACRTAGRNLSEEEWKTYFPGQPYRKSCGDLRARE